MGQAWQEWGGVVLATVAAVPLAAALAALVARWRIRRGHGRAYAWRASVVEVGIVVGAVPWVWMILTPRDSSRLVNLVPLRELAGQLVGDTGVAVAQVGGNLLVFAAFGALAPVRFPALARLPLLAALAAGGSLTAEALQYGLDAARPVLRRRGARRLRGRAEPGGVRPLRAAHLPDGHRTPVMQDD